MEKEVKQSNTNTPAPEPQTLSQKAVRIATQAHETPKRKPWFIVGITVLVLLLLGTTGFLAYQNQQLKKQIFRMKVPLTPSSQATEGLYYNADYQFTFRYPKDWAFEEKLISEMKVPTRFGCIAGGIHFMNEDKNLIAYVYYRYPGICSNTAMRSGVGYVAISPQKTINIGGVDIPFVYLGDTSQENPTVQELFYNDSRFVKIGDLEFLFGTTEIEFDKDFSIDGESIEEVNTIFKSLRVPSVSEPVEIESILGTAHEYTQSYAIVQQRENKNELWDKVESLCADPKFDRNTADSYKIMQIDIVNSRPSEDPDYYIITTNISTGSGDDPVNSKWMKHENKELLMIKRGGIWKALTWNFFE